MLICPVCENKKVIIIENETKICPKCEGKGVIEENQNQKDKKLLVG